MTAPVGWIASRRSTTANGRASNQSAGVRQVRASASAGWRADGMDGGLLRAPRALRRPRPWCLVQRCRRPPVPAGPQLGLRLRKRTSTSRDELTQQELQVALVVAQGVTNREAGIPPVPESEDDRGPSLAGISQTRRADATGTRPPPRDRCRARRTGSYPATRARGDPVHGHRPVHRSRRPSRRPRVVGGEARGGS